MFGKNKVQTIPEAELEFRLWPISKENSYIELVNPECLAADLSKLGYVPTRVTSYKDETNDSLKRIRNQTVPKLKNLGTIRADNRKQSDKGYDFPQLYGTLLASGMGFVIPSFFTNNWQVVLPIGTTVATVSTIGSAYAWIKRRGDIKKEIKNFDENIKRFETTPVDKFRVIRDEEIEDIANNIETGQPLRITEPKNIDYLSSIETMIHRIGGTISPFPKVYEQKLASYRKQ